MKGKAVKIFQKFTSDQRADRHASFRLGQQQRIEIGTSFWFHPSVPGIAFTTRKAANFAAEEAMAIRGTA